MKKQKKPQTFLSFFIQIEKMKTVLRHSWTSDKNRQESDAEHSWMMGLIAMTLFSHLHTTVDQTKVLKLVLLHDLAEIITGDIPSFEISKRREQKQESERNALRTIFHGLPQETKNEFFALWEEFEAKETTEAKLAQAIDKMEAIIQHNIADITTWDQGDFDMQPFYRNDYFDFDAFLREFRNEVETMSLTKVLATQTMHRIKPEHAREWKKLQKKNAIRA